MCTVTYIPGRQSILLTSNRDEKIQRATAVYPASYGFRTGNIMFPKDADAGGTWIAVHENGNAIVLLNGGLVKHIPSPPYRKSRGIIVLDLIDSEDPYQACCTLDLGGIEPFTAIIWDAGKLYECRWDGVKKYIKKPDPSTPHIWSSVTLYTPEVIAKRERWFSDWLKKNPSPTQDEALRFHQFTGDGDVNNDLLMNRDGETFTVSITSVNLGETITAVRYLDLKNKQTADSEFVIKQNMYSLK